MKQASKHLVNLIKPIVEGLGYECVGIDYNLQSKQGLLRIYIDHEKGVFLEDCTKVSHQISAMMDVENPVSTHYELEISSPGEDRPLFNLAQFERFIGRIVEIKLFKLVEKRRKITGKIQKVDNNIIFLQEQNKILQIPFTAMSTARLVPQYSL